MDENRTRLEQPQQDAPKKRSLWPLFFFPMALLYHELLLHAFDRTILFWDTPLVYILLFSAAGGFLLSALVDILPRRAAHIVTYALCVFWTVLTCIEYCCKSYFKSYWGLSFITQMTGNVVGNFFSTMLEIIFGRIVFILLSFLPLVLLIILRRRLLPGKTLSVRCPRYGAGGVRGVSGCRFRPVLYRRGSGGLHLQLRHRLRRAPLRSGSHHSAGGPVRHLRSAGRAGDPGGRAGAG